MDIYLHTIAVEPARWTPQRVSQPLTELLPHIAGTSFRQLEIFEPHLALARDEEAVLTILRTLNLQPVVLSSYINVTPSTTPDSEWLKQCDELIERVRRFGFERVRLFPGPGMAPTAPAEDRRKASSRIIGLANRAPEIEFLLETHDGSLADDPRVVVEFVDSIGCENVGLLFQPTLFTQESARAQLEVQKHLVRHVHLQNRADDTSKFARLRDGVIDWRALFSQLDPAVTASLEFVPRGICSPAEFDLKETLAEAETEWESIRREPGEW